MNKLILGFLNVVLPSRKDTNQQINTSMKVSVDIVFQELFQEYRRYRDNEITSSTWYMAFLLAILGFEITVNFGKDFLYLKFLLVSHPLLLIIIAILITFFGCASVSSIRWSNLRYAELKQYIFFEKKEFFNNVEYFNFSPRPLPDFLKPNRLILYVHFMIISISNIIILSNLGICYVLISFFLLIIIFLLIFCIYLPEKK